MYQEVIEKTKAIEGYLQGMGATGKGLHEKLDSVQFQLPEDVVRRIRKVATMRNKLMHETGYNIDLDGFNFAADNSLAYLKGEKTSPKKLDTERFLTEHLGPERQPTPHPNILRSAAPAKKDLKSAERSALPPELELATMAAKGFWRMPLKKKLFAATSALAAVAVAIKLNT